MRTLKTEVVVLGAGIGGYSAAFYAADRDKKVILVEKEKRLGGVCLHCGCIPSKALLHQAKLIEEVRLSRERGVSFGKPRVNRRKLLRWKEAILEKLGSGIESLANQRKVRIIKGIGHFEDSHTLRVETEEGQKFIEYEHAILAAGSKPTLPEAFDLGNRRIMTSREALDLPEIPETLLVVGGGYIGLELGTVYAALGSQVTLVEAQDHLLPGVDHDLVRPVLKYAKQHFSRIELKTKVLKMATGKGNIRVEMERDGKLKQECFDRVLVAIGRSANDEDLGLGYTKVRKDAKGFVQVDEQQRTDDEAIFAVGDIAGGLLLAHKAAKEARVAVDALCGEPSSSRDVVIPAVVFTDPEVAWCGLTETEAKQKGLSVEIVRFPWQASGRALTVDRPDGLTKLVVDKETERVLGVGMVGAGAGELISEGVLAIEMGATAADLAESVHPHPTLSETIMEAAHRFYGTATHLLGKRS